MEIKIIGKSVVPDKITLYENDLGAKHLVFSSNRINDGVNLDKLSAYLEIEREEGVSDRFILDKTVNGDTLYFTLPINLALTETADLISSQLVFENDEKTLSYRTKVFYIDVKNSVDGVSSYEQVVPTVLSQLESKMEKAVENCTQIKSDIEFYKEDFENNIEETSSKIKDEVLAQVSESSVDDALSTESTNPVQNKVVTEALDGKVKKNTSFNAFMKVYGQTSDGEERMYEFAYSPKSGNLAYYDYSDLGAYDNNGTIITYNNGAVSTAIPKKPSHATPKKWVEDLVNENKGTKLYKHIISLTSDFDEAYIVFYSLSNENEYLVHNQEYIWIKGEKLISYPYLYARLGINSVVVNGGYASLENNITFSIIIGSYNLNITSVSEVIEEA